MSDIKKWLHNKIKNKAAKRERLSQEIAERRNNVEAFILNILDELDSNIAMTANTSLFNDANFMQCYVGSVQERVRTLDKGASVSISWGSKEEKQDVLPRLNGILIKWSHSYQAENKCEPELFVDLGALLFK